MPFLFEESIIRSPELFVFDESIKFRISFVIIDVTADSKLTFDCFFRTLGDIKMKFGQISVQLMATTSNFNPIVKRGN